MLYLLYSMTTREKVYTQYYDEKSTIHMIIIIKKYTSIYLKSVQIILIKIILALKKGRFICSENN
jgi:hypothetical protein